MRPRMRSSAASIVDGQLRRWPARARAQAQFAKLRQRQIGNLAVAVGRAVDAVVMIDHAPPVTALPNHDLDHIDAGRDTVVDAGQAVLGNALPAATMRDDQHVLSESAKLAASAAAWSPPR